MEEANKDKEWRREIMMIEMKLRDERKAGLREGIEKGLKEGNSNKATETESPYSIYCRCDRVERGRSA